MLDKNYDLLEKLTEDELNQFRKAIDNNFQVVKDKEKTITDYHSVWFDLYNKCLKYSYLNNKEITNGYPVMENRTFGDMVKIMIKEQLKTKE